MKNIADFMTKEVITVGPETSLIEAVNIILKNKFNGLPVVDEDKKLIGIITEYDLVLKGSSIHLPTFMKLMGEIDIYRRDSNLIKDDLKNIMKLKVGDVMNPEPLTLKDTDSIFEAVDVFGKHHRVNPIPIISGENTLVGILSRHDILKFMGDYQVNVSPNAGKEEIDKSVDVFLKNFRSKFVVVTKFRTRFWLIASILFALIGFIIAWALILRVNFQ